MGAVNPGAGSVDLRKSLVLGASGLAIAMGAAAQPALAQVVEPIIITQDDTAFDIGLPVPVYLINRADGTYITKQTYFGYLLLENEAGASIAGLTLAPPSSPVPFGFYPAQTTIVNAGTIDGDLLLTNGNVYVNEGGSVTGTFATFNGNAAFGTPQFSSGYNTQTFIDRAGNGVGNFDPGNGVDYYIESFSTDGSGVVAFTLSDQLPTNFEVHGVEALGEQTVVAVLNTVEGQANDGLSLWGDGQIINRAIIDPISSAGSGIPTGGATTNAVVYGGEAGENYVFWFPLLNEQTGQTIAIPISYGPSLTSFANESTINGDITIRTANFENSGTINFGSINTLISTGVDTGFTFNNSGTMTAANAVAPTGPALTNQALTIASSIATTTLTPVEIINSGSIDGGFAFAGFASDFVLDNSGSIDFLNNPVGIGTAISIELGQIELPFDPATVPDGFLIGSDSDVFADNASIINRLGASVIGGIDADLAAYNVVFRNDGGIYSNAADPYGDAISLGQDDIDGALDNDSTDPDSFYFENNGEIVGKTEIETSATQVTIINTGTMQQARTDLLSTSYPFPTNRDALEVDVENNFSGSVTFDNSGFISTADYGATGVAIDVLSSEAAESGVVEAESATATIVATNSGTIRATGGNYLITSPYTGLAPNELLWNYAAGIAMNADAQGGSSITFTNTADGEINSRGIAYFTGPDGPVAIADPNGTAGGLAVLANAEVVTISNAGTIIGSPGANSLVLGNGSILIPEGDFFLDFEGVIGGAIDTFAGADTITNELTGSITGGIATRSGNDRLINYGTITGNILMGFGNDIFNNTGTQTGSVQMGDGNDIVTSLLSGIGSNLGTVSGGIGVDSFIFVVNQGGSLQEMGNAQIDGFEYVALGGTGTVTSSGDVAMAPIQLATGNITLAAGSTLTASGEFALLGGADLSQTFTNNGTINGSVDLGRQNDTFANYGTLNGNLLLGLGDDTFIQGINAVLVGTADGGEGTDAFLLDITGGGTIDQSLYTRLLNFETLDLTGEGDIDTGGGVLPVQTVVLTGTEPVVFGEDAVIQTLGPVAITGSEGGNDLANQGTIIGDVNLGGGEDELDNSGTIQGDVDLGAGDDGFENSGTIEGDVELGTGDDLLENAGTIEGDVGGGEGSDTLLNDGTIIGDVGLGSGGDVLVNDGTIEGDVNLDGDLGTAPATIVAFPMAMRETGLTASLSPLALVPAPAGGDDVFTNTLLVTGNVDMGAGNDTFTNSGTVEGNVSMGTGDDKLVLSGTIDGDVSLGDGNDALELQPGWMIGGSVDAGAGTDTLRVTYSGTGTMANYSAWTGFERYSQLGGSATLTGANTFGQFDVLGGQLITAAGSTLAGNVNVANGASLIGSGTVNGNLAVSGLLSPGNPIGTMTVNGNVSLASTADLLMQFTAAASDALVVNGTFTIANGASLTMTGSRPLTPGAYNLVTATGGINGTFGTNVTRDATVLGVLAYTDTSIQLLSTIQLTANPTAQVGLTTAYLNSLLANGTYTAPILAAFPSLVDGTGFGDAEVINSLSPEAFASVGQLSIDQGLAIASALREGGVATTSESGLFVFVQGFGSWRDFDGDGRGVSEVEQHNKGFLAGVGFGRGGFDFSAFIGHSEMGQSIDALRAQTDADGAFIGARARYLAGGLNLGASIIRDEAEADTNRAPGYGSVLRSNYDLEAITIDAWVGYDFAFGSRLTVMPQVGVTHISVDRGEVGEGSNGNPFALQVEQQDFDATFVDADIKLGFGGTGMIQPWVSAGVRHLLDGDEIIARGAFLGTPTGYTVAGVERSDTLPHVGAGITASPSEQVNLFLKGEIEFGDQAAKSVSGGVRFRF